MYLCFREKGWTPGQYYWQTDAEKRITRVFLQKLMEERQEEIRQINKSVGK